MTTILLVDDSESDLFLLERILSRLAAPHRVATARDGVEAQQQLWRLAAATTPQDRVVVLTDLEMPRQNGLEFLDWLKHTPEFRNLDVVMLSGCSDSAFMNKAYEILGRLPLTLIHSLSGSLGDISFSTCANGKISVRNRPPKRRIGL